MRLFIFTEDSQQFDKADCVIESAQTNYIYSINSMSSDKNESLKGERPPICRLFIWGIEASEI